MLSPAFSFAQALEGDLFLLAQALVMLACKLGVNQQNQLNLKCV